MKTTTKKQVQSSVPVQHSHTAEKAAKTEAQQSTTNTQTAHASPPSHSSYAERTDTRLPIDHDTRALNRKLDTAAVIGALRDTRPDVYKRAVIVGTWVWVAFDVKPEPETRAQLAQLGFHWNNNRQVWQHPCGHFSFGSKSDPRDTYASKPSTEAFN